MEDTNKTAQPLGGVDIPQEVQEEARSIISGAFRLFANHNQRLADDLAQFNEKRKQIRENVEHGAKRTTGRIV